MSIRIMSISIPCYAVHSALNTQGFVRKFLCAVYKFSFIQFVQQIHPVTSITQGLREEDLFFQVKFAQSVMELSQLRYYTIRTTRQSVGFTQVLTDKTIYFKARRSCENHVQWHMTHDTWPGMQFVQLVKCRLAMTRGLRDEVIYFSKSVKFIKNAVELSKSCLCLYPSMQFIQLVKGSGALIMSEVCTKRGGAIRIMSTFYYSVNTQGFVCKFLWAIYRINFHSCNSYSWLAQWQASLIDWGKRIYFFPSEVRTKRDRAVTITLLYNSYNSSNGGLHSGTEGRGYLFFQVSQIHIERGGAIRITSMSVP